MQLFLVGDIHGKWNTLFDKLDFYKIRDCVLVAVGDLGIGYTSPRKEFRGLKLLNNRFKKRGIDFMAIRGNHDDPSYFNSERKWSNILFLKDYSTFEHNGEKFLCVGGAVSVDRRDLIPGQSWWEDEVFILDPEKTEKCDVLITHSGPNWIGPVGKDDIESWCKNDPTLYDECCVERLEHNKLFELCKPSYAYCGHFHRSAWVCVDGCTARILDELEIFNHGGYSN